ESVKATLKFAVAFADGEEVLGSEYELNWMINRFRITEDMWDKSGKNGVTLKLPAQFAAMLADENLLKISCSYYEDQNGAALEGLDFKGKGGNSYWVSATLTGEEANNFEFENGLQVSDKTVYTVPQSKTEAFFGSVASFAKTNWLWLVIAAAVLLFLIILICIIASSKKKKRKREELAEQRRLEEKEERKREQEEREERRREEREERMARMSQQQMMMPQMMPQGMPQTGGQPMSMGGGYTGGGSVSEAQILQMQAELAELKAEKLAKEAAQQQIAQAKTDIQFAGFMAQLMGGGSLDKLTEIIRTEVRNALADEKSAAQPHDEHRAEEAKEAAPVCPPDAVMTTVTTTKIDTTKKSTQTAERAAAPAPAVRTVVRNVVAPMPVDDGRVFDVGGFYTPADPVTDEGSGEEDKH
ncbi:MAG: hypothetical protein K2G26_00580, partial [Clostridia bacterium]|nr:hypothetical protein [Clostridia bacterium]